MREDVKRLPVLEGSPVKRRHLPLASGVGPEDRAARPGYVVWELTLKCDLACVHCGSRAGKARPDELSTAEALALVEQLAKLGTREVTLIGGEAYLHEGWLEIVAALHGHGIEVGLLTGGRGMTLARAEAAKRAGATTISVSVDALEATHDFLRGRRGSYASALAAIEHAKAAGLRVSANTQIALPALREIEPMFEGLLERGIAAWQVSMTVPMGRAADRPEILLDPYRVIEVLPMLARLTRSAKALGVGIFPGNDIGYFGPFESELRPHGHRSPCSAGVLGMGIEADGAIKGCPSLPSSDYVGGNVRDAALVDIWERAEPLRFARKRGVDSLWGYCASCYYAEACLGGCSWTAHVLFGKTGNNPYCHHRALELLREGMRERIVQVARAPGEPFDFGRFDCVQERWPEEERRAAERIAETGEGFLPS